MSSLGTERRFAAVPMFDRYWGDCVAKLFCPSERVRLIQDQASMRNVDSRIHSLRFDCFIFLFYSLPAVTFATQSGQSGLSLGADVRSACGAVVASAPYGFFTWSAATSGPGKASTHFRGIDTPLKKSQFRK